MRKWIRNWLNGPRNVLSKSPPETPEEAADGLLTTSATQVFIRKADNGWVLLHRREYDSRKDCYNMNVRIVGEGEDLTAHLTALMVTAAMGEK